ncbi:Threonylcarbamoyl-AMP synthase [Plasmodiophora brassicae]|nr:hypothetical protein PBRA_002273 [Plasmodiophora brassicae]
MTQRWRLADIDAAAAAIRSGDVVAFPTETVYGAGANALSDTAVKRIFDAKGRPSDNPLIVHVPDADAARRLVAIDNDAVERDFSALASAFWPGPLTIVLRHAAPLSPLVTAGLDTVGVRVPDHDHALALLRACAVPVAAPSANLSGKPSPTNADHVFRDLGGVIAGVLDGGDTGVGLESTVVDCSREPYVVLRPGGVTLDALRRVVGHDRVVAHDGTTTTAATPRAPGMKYTHYAPSIPLHYVKGDDNAAVQRYVHELQEQSRQRVAVLTPASGGDRVVAGDRLVTCGTAGDASSVARALYACLRSFEQCDDVDVIVAYGFPSDGLGQAIMNRLLKASSTIV